MTLLQWDAKRPETPPRGTKWNDPAWGEYRKALLAWKWTWKAKIVEPRRGKAFVEIRKTLGDNALIVIDEDGNMKVSSSGKIVMNPEQSRELVQAVEEAMVALAQRRNENAGR